MWWLLFPHAVATFPSHVPIRRLLLPSMGLKNRCTKDVAGGCGSALPVSQLDEACSTMSALLVEHVVPNMPYHA